MAGASSYTSISQSSVAVSGTAIAQSMATQKVETHATQVGSGSVTVSVDGVSLGISYYLAADGLRARVHGYDLGDPTAARIDEDLILQPGEHRVVEVPRVGRPPVPFHIHRVGDGLQVVAATSSK